MIYDAEGLKSEQATVKLVNTATTTNDSRGGGGSLGVFGVIGLMGLALYRRFK
ncbi:GlyGly-CTERM sorting domain-containing protein [Acinetobacter sp. UGAL515B_02]|nr:GlyGly-CTERM sorting domain-containing protein [Acinetobacter sp. UGAL515B_02]WON80458.1 GlyGly-CTERM sorting domain-containing protein [Acinetobacter sp. UGAL515B_02]